MADELLVAWTTVLGGTVLATAATAIGYLLRRLHELRDRILRLETHLERLALIEEMVIGQGTRGFRRSDRAGGRRGN